MSRLYKAVYSGLFRINEDNSVDCYDCVNGWSVSLWSAVEITQTKKWLFTIIGNNFIVR